MKTKHPIKTDLFRFVTTRTPEHITPQAKASKFIFHPDPNASAARDCPNAKDEGGFQRYLSGFNPVSRYEDIRNIKPELYDFVSKMLNAADRMAMIPLPKRPALELDPQQRINLWDQLFYQVLTGKSDYVRQAVLKMIIADRMLQEITARSAWLAYKEYRVVIPRFVIECARRWLYARCGEGIKGVNKLGIADFRKIEQEVCCYVPGEVSHIENILAKEYKERHTRNLVSSETTTELTTEVEIENLTDTTTATRNELQSEIANVIDQQNTSNYGGSLSVSGKVFGAEVVANAYMDFANSNSSAYSNSSAKLYAEETVRHALERIVQRTTEKRTSRVLKEFEENNKHGFDNRNGDEHVTGIYRWVDVIYTNRLVNYGKRLMFEFMVPEPASFFKRAIKYKPTEEPAGSGNGNGNEDEPKTLQELGINGPADITRSNYAQLASEYGITIPSPMAASQTVSQAFSPTPPIKHNGTPWTQQFSVPVPPDYEADTVSGNYSFEFKAWGFAPDAYFTFDIGGISGGQTGLRSSSKITRNGTINGTFTNKHSGQVPILFNGRQLYTYGTSVVVTCRLKASKFSDWQTSAYNQLQTAYNNLLAQSQSTGQGNGGSDVSGDEEDLYGNTNPAFNRIIEQRELKRACIELITKPFCRDQGKDFLSDLNACDKYEIPQIVQNEAFEKYAAQVKFFEQAFDWSIMSYIFYPYYWADKCDWAELLQSGDADLIFQAFKQAGMARVVVPVRPEFNEAVMYYLETGMIWLGGDIVVETEDDLYLSIAEEMDTITPSVEEEWETRVPTTLAIVQQRSAALNEEGLPCCTTVESHEVTTNIIGSGNTLQIIKP